MTSWPYVLYKNWLLLRVISIRRCIPAGFKLTKLFGIDDFSAAKDFGKVFIIIPFFIIITIIITYMWTAAINNRPFAEHGHMAMSIIITNRR